MADFTICGLGLTKDGEGGVRCASKVECKNCPSRTRKRGKAKAKNIKPEPVNKPVPIVEEKREPAVAPAPAPKPERAVKPAKGKKLSFNPETMRFE